MASAIGAAADSTKDMQYCNAVGHRNFLSCIVRCDLPDLMADFRDALAVSLRVDGSIDRFQVDNEFVMAKLVLEDGSDRVFFMGFSRPEERGAKGTSFDF